MSHTAMHSEIYHIAYQLYAEGKNPSVALIRSRLSKPTSLPNIIQALQQWKLTPELGKAVKTPAPQTNTDQSSTAQPLDNHGITQRLDRLEAKMDQIIALLHQQK